MRLKINAKEPHMQQRSRYANKEIQRNTFANTGNQDAFTNDKMMIIRNRWKRVYH